MTFRKSIPGQGFGIRSFALLYERPETLGELYLTGSAGCRAFEVGDCDYSPMPGVFHIQPTTVCNF
ncbi:hypothetical protein HRM2_33080 [Desulforapulum autotrophicum HRM2]|uniref:Uncharacterized protein n=1 Tax=Desulforapulum autotrophicum (strain ATCC 43914 / DSM 3382 / VKM B-1955 / HRM2) TaxID=177437 RepID=C0QM66_DESAH|nr:hypothetical protein HRM2_33080 [Desulforapulum autotrophicum HRM2]